MTTVIKLKRGTTTPTTSNIVSGEIAVDTSAQKLYINDASTIKTIGLGNPSVSDISDLTATATELNYTDGVTSNIQTQLDAKLPLSGGTMSGIIAGFQSTGIDDNATSTAVTINSGGNVGIGTSSPTAGYKLDVNGPIGGPNATFQIYPSPGVSARRTLNLSNNANATLHLDHDGGYNRFGTDGSSQHIAFCAGGSAAGDINVVFKGDGNVGLGITNPSYKLHVVGDINYTGTLYKNGVASGGSPTQVLIKNSSGTTIKVRVGLNAGGTTANIKNSVGTTLITSVGPFISGDATF